MKQSLNDVKQELHTRIVKIEERFKTHQEILTSIEDNRQDSANIGLVMLEECGLRLNRMLIRKDMASFMDLVVRLSGDGQIKWPNLSDWLEKTRSLMCNLK